MKSLLNTLKEIYSENFISFSLIALFVFAMLSLKGPTFKTNKLSSYERENLLLTDYALNCLNIDHSDADQYSTEFVECLSVSAKIKANQEMHNKYIARICL